MARHFLQLYLLIVATLAAVSWGQEQLWQTYAQRDPAEMAAENPSQTAMLDVVEAQMRALPAERRQSFVRQLARESRVDLELFDLKDIAGADTLAGLSRGEVVYMDAASGERWMLKQITGDAAVLAFRHPIPEQRRGLVDWTLAFIFYAAIALVIMMWLWPLRRDLQRLEHATSTFGNRNWAFDAAIGPQSQIHPLAQAFRRMAARIDGLIRSHKDMSNAMSHEIKTPLARMRFEVEVARAATSPGKMTEHLNNIDTDITELNAFVTATLDYAILERAEVALNLSEHDFTAILPAVTDAVRRSSRTALDLRCEVDPAATHVRCDAHLLETVLRNLMYNALRYAQREVVVRFEIVRMRYRLCVEDDGPGIPEADRQRVFESFVQLDHTTQHKAGFGLGLAIVRRVVEWHGGDVSVDTSPLGGARFCVTWGS
jgi:two-component system, OmpR family, sensor kinase